MTTTTLHGKCIVHHRDDDDSNNGNKKKDRHHHSNGGSSTEDGTASATSRIGMPDTDTTTTTTTVTSADASLMTTTETVATEQQIGRRRRSRITPADNVDGSVIMDDDDLEENNDDNHQYYYDDGYDDPFRRRCHYCLPPPGCLRRILRGTGGTSVSVSNLLFLLGSILYTWVAIWDLVDEYRYGHEEDDDNDKIYWKYLFLSAAAALCYVFDALLDLSRLLIDSGGSSARQIIPINDDDDDDDDNTISSTREEPSSYYFLLNHTSHQIHDDQPKSLQWCLALTFGVASILDLLSSATGELGTDVVSNITGWGAVHLYLVNAAILLLGGQNNKQQFFPKSLSLESLGDAFFALGSITDVLASYFYSDDRMYEWSNLVASVLWLIDAVLYILIDCLEEDDDDDSSSSGSASNTGGAMQQQQQQQQQQPAELLEHKSSAFEIIAPRWTAAGREVTDSVFSREEQQHAVAWNRTMTSSPFQIE